MARRPTQDVIEQNEALLLLKREMEKHQTEEAVEPPIHDICCALRLEQWARTLVPKGSQNTVPILAPRDHQLFPYFQYLDALPHLSSLQHFALHHEWHHGDLPAHWLTETFDAKTKKSQGITFTPEWLALNMVKKGLNISEQDIHNLNVLEPSCGSGVFILAFCQYFIEREKHLKEQAPKRPIQEQSAPSSTGHPIHFFTQQLTAWDQHPLCVLAARLNWLRALHRLGHPLTNLNYPIHLKNALQQKRSFQQKINKERSPYDLIIGNPPWGPLTRAHFYGSQEQHSNQLLQQWQQIYPTTHQKERFSVPKEDISTLFTQHIIDHHLHPKGILAFLTPKSLLKASKSNLGFRHHLFHPTQKSSCDFNRDENPRNITEHRYSIGIKSIDELKHLKNFSNATCRGMAIYAIKGEQTLSKIPVHHLASPISKTPSQTPWNKPQHLGAGIACPKQSFIPETEIEKKVLPNSDPWFFLPPQTSHRELQKWMGEPDYKAYSGVFSGGANAVFYHEILDFEQQKQTFSPTHKTVDTRNINHRAKRFFPSKEQELETEYLYPLVCGRDVSQWSIQRPAEQAILLPHASHKPMYAIKKETLRKHAPHTFTYLEGALDFLKARKGLTAMDRKVSESTPYNLCRVGPYTFSPHKVVWRYIHKHFTCAVLEPVPWINGQLKTMIPQEKLMMIPTSSAMEAYYLCALLSSSAICTIVEALMMDSHISTHVIQNLKLPKFCSDNRLQLELASLCQKGHHLDQNDLKGRKALISKIDILAQDLISCEP